VRSPTRKFKRGSTPRLRETGDWRARSTIGTDPEAERSGSAQRGASHVEADRGGNGRRGVAAGNGGDYRRSGETLQDETPRASPEEISGRSRSEQAVEVVRNGEDGTKRVWQTRGSWCFDEPSGPSEIGSVDDLDPER
jgi:hypothetical protein